MLFTGAQTRKLALPKDWKSNYKNAFLHAVSLSHAAMTNAISHAWNSSNPRLRDQARIQRLQKEVYFLREQNNILLERFSRFPPMKRPHYTPLERMRIMSVKAGLRLSLTKTSSAFLVDSQTIYNWTKALREGDGSLLKTSVPVNRFPDFIRQMVKHLKAAHSNIGVRKIADILARAGIHIAATTVRRFCKESNPAPKGTEQNNAGNQPSANVATYQNQKAKRIVTAKRPDHVWHIDLTLLPTGKGFWVPWLPFAIMQQWPFCWWMLIVHAQIHIDYFRLM